MVVALMSAKVDQDFYRLFTWAVIKYLCQVKQLTHTITPEVTVDLLSVEGVRNKLKITSELDGVSEDIYPILRRFRKRSRASRLRLVTRILKGH